MHEHSIAISGLNVARYALQVLGNNIANAGTEGYHRQDPVISPVTGDPLATLPIGYGAEITTIRRASDILLENQIWSQRPELGQTDQELSTLRALESVLGDLTAGALADAISTFFGTLEELASQPDSSIFRAQAIGAASAMSAEFRALGQSLDDLAAQVAQAARSTIDQVNELAARVAECNRAVQELSSRNSNDGNLLDQRDQAVSDLAELADIRVIVADDGAYNVYAYGTPIVLKGHTTELEVDYTGMGQIGLSVKDAHYYDTFPSGGRLGAHLALHNTLLPQVADQVDTLAAAIIRQVNQAHVEGVGKSGAFTTLTGQIMSDEAIGDWDMPVSAGDIVVRLTDTATGDVTRHLVTITDPATETLADVAALFDALPGLSASLGGGRLNLVADAGTAFDFRPAILADPATSTLTGTAVPTLSGVYEGDTNQTLTATVVGSGEVGVASALALEIRDGSGDLIRAVNVGVGYAAGDPLVFAAGIDLALGQGTLNAGEQFTVEATARSDSTGFLAAVGVNTFFTGTSAAGMGLAAAIQASPSNLACALGADGLGNRNAFRMADVGNQPIDALSGELPADAFRIVMSDVGHWVAFREARLDGLQNLLAELARQRDETSGVDVNEEAANLLVLENMFQAMAKYLSAVDEAHKVLMELV